jgi:hypothetical protein
MRFSKALLNLAVFSALLASPMAAAEIITFEGFDNLTVFTTQYPGVNFQGAKVLTEGLSLNPLFPPASGVNVVFNPVGPIELVFSTPVDFFNGRFTYNNGLTVQGFDVSDALIATAVGAFAANLAGSGNTPNELIGISAAGIKRVLITGGDGDNFTLDDASFTGSVDVGKVPEPSSIALVAAGVAFVALRRKRVL